MSCHNHYENIVKEINLVDLDEDNVPNDKDECPETPSGRKVNETGCPDEDGDGIKDSNDKCLESPLGYTVNQYGCSENDEDQDDVPFYLDKCPATPIGFLVDDNGCQHKMNIIKNFIDTEAFYSFSLKRNYRSISYSNNGCYLAISYNDYLQVVSTEDMKTQLFLEFQSSIRCIQFSFNSKYLFIVENKFIIIDVSTWKTIQTIDLTGKGYINAISPKGTYIAGYRLGYLYIIHARTGKILTKIKKKRRYDDHKPVFSHDENYLVAGNYPYEVGSGKGLSHYLGDPSGFTSDNLYYISRMKVYNVGTWDIVCEFGGDIISADGNFFVNNSNISNTSDIFEIGSWKKVQHIEGTIENFSEKWIFSSTRNDTFLKLDKSNLEFYKLNNGFINLNNKKMANRLAKSYNTIESNYKRKLELINNTKVQDLTYLRKADKYEKGEFETQNEFKARVKKLKAKEKIIIYTFKQRRNELRRERVYKRMKLIEQYNVRLNNLLLASRKPIDDCKVSFKKYRADGKYFPVSIYHENTIPFHGIVRVPRANARTFKKNIDQLQICAEVQSTIRNNNKFINIVIHNPNTGNSYYLAKTKSYQDKDIPLPPKLKATVKFNEPSGNYALDAEETGYIVVEFQNNGKGSAFQVTTRLVASTVIRDLDYPSEKIIPEISPTSTQKVIFPLKSGLDIPEQNVLFTVEFDEKNGFPPDPMRIKFQTRKLLEPKLEIVDYFIDDFSKDGKIQHEEVVKTTFRIQNKGQGIARSVTAKVSYGPNVFQALNVPMEYDIGALKPNGIKEFKVAFYTNQRLKNKLPLTVELFEERYRFNYSKAFAFKMNVKEKTVFETVIKAKAQKTVQITDLKSPSDIDIDIPKTGFSVQGVAVVIGNYDYKYKNVPKVEYARRDATVISEYLKQVFGFPSENIISIHDASLANMVDVFGSKGKVDKSRISHFFSEGDEIFIYYTGHGLPGGFPDKKGYLVPVDANPDNIETTGYSLETLYSNLNQINARKKTIVIDACFSGESQSGSILKSSSRMYIKADLGQLKNGTIITSSSGRQMASWYHEKRHSIFTYFFLKGIKHSAAKKEPLTYEQLQPYVTNSVNKVSKKLYSRIQEPQFRGNLSQEVFCIGSSD